MLCGFLWAHVNKHLLTSAQAHTIPDRRNRSSQEFLQGAGAVTAAALPSRGGVSGRLPPGAPNTQATLLDLLFLAKILYNRGEEGALGILHAARASGALIASLAV